MCAGHVSGLGGCPSLCQPDGGEGERWYTRPLRIIHSTPDALQCPPYTILCGGIAVDTSMHFCPHRGYRYRGWLDWRTSVPMGIPIATFGASCSVRPAMTIFPSIMAPSFMTSNGRGCSFAPPWRTLRYGHGLARTTRV